MFQIWNPCCVKTVSGILKNSLITRTIVLKSLSYLNIYLKVIEMSCVNLKSLFCFLDIYIQGYPQRMRLQKRLFLNIYDSDKLVSFFNKSWNKLLKNFVHRSRLNLTLKLSYYLSLEVVFSVLSFAGNPVWGVLVFIFIMRVIFPSQIQRIIML